jgi:4-aminobutyrate aminotransferase-like enzyme
MNNEFPLINKDDEQHSLQILKKYYDEGLIAPEKKAYLTDLRSSVGPYMGMAGADGRPHYMLDAASQIATLGLGFNPGAFFGTAHYQESWLNDRWSPEVQKIRQALDQFFKRKLEWDSISTTLVNSGAEANETALGYCYQYRSRCHADKVLAFEGSFHGRMMVALSATWNADKRVPFEWPSKETIYCEYPDLGSDEIHQPMPNFWREVWDQATRQDFSLPMGWTSDDSLLHLELKVLMQVREQLLTGRLFAILIEPMQCEGGDRYASDRFHTALLLMARSFKVPVVYDEVQTGFHLGREFFWHKQFNLRDLDGSELRPSYIVCAKKAQVGLVISPCQVDAKIFESYQVSSLIRGYHHAIALDQLQERIISLEKKARHHLERWQQEFPDHLLRPRAMGLSFAIDLADSSFVSAFINNRFAHGLLYYPAGSHTLRFRLNTAFSNEDLQFLFKELSRLSHFIFHGTATSLPTRAPGREHQTQEIYQWQELILQTRLKLSHKEKITPMQVFNQISILMAKQFDGELIQITASNFERYRGAIQDIQRLTYEPSRQTSIDKFDETARSGKGIALGFLKKGKLEGIVFAAPLKHVELERGVRNDPYYHDDSVLYMLDTTINEDYRGAGLGRFMKYALTTLAMVQGVKRLHGRNRDRLAASMMAINFSLGAYELQYIAEDYPDFEEFRDVFYYTQPTLWDNIPLRLSHALDCPLSLRDLNQDYIKEQLPLINNKICLSNFTSESYLKNLQTIAKLLPQELRHVYTTSGQAEAVDKVAKSLWYTSQKNSYHMLTFQGHEFGRGSFVSRALSDPKADYFPVTHLEKPTMENMEAVLLSVEETLDEIDVLAIWIEPVLQQTMERTPEIFLMELKKLADLRGVALVYNETASSFYRYDQDNFFISNNPLFTPTAGLCFTGGQSGIAYTHRSRFVDKPLMLISTWDGDEFAMANFTRALEQVQANKEQFFKDAFAFDYELSHLLSEHQVSTIELMNGTGLVMGEIPKQLTQFFLPSPLGYKICASWGEMQRFLKELPEMKKLMDRLPWR